VWQKLDKLEGLLDDRLAPRMEDMNISESAHPKKIVGTKSASARVDQGQKFAWICSWPSESPRFHIGIGERESKNRRKDLSVHFHTGLPLLDYLVRMEFSFGEFPLCPSISCQIAFSVIVPDDSTFMKACLEGDIFTVREQVKNRHSRPKDRTPENMTPLMVSECGSTSCPATKKSHSLQLKVGALR
jgi:hypothetical protein